MLQFVIVAGAVLVGMMAYTAIAFAYIQSNHYWKMVQKLTEKIYNVDDL
jgi:hypothetical protein